MIAILIISGLFLLYVGAELLVKYASHMAAALGIPSVIIGLTVVAYGTSSPEVVVNIYASLAGNSDIALGNIVGSNIFNVLVVLGLAAMISPLRVHKQLIRLDVPIMIFASLLLWFAGSYGVLTFWVGVSFLILIIAYTAILITKAKKQKSKEFDREYKISESLSIRVLIKDIVIIAISLGILALGSTLLVEGSVSLARLLGISDLIISLTIIAAGTGLPELATSAIAAFRGERDIAVGNILGSNIFNIFGILGISAVLAPQGINVSDSALAFDIPVMVAVAIACLPILFLGHTVYRWEGALFFAYYILYIIHLLTAQSRPWMESFRDALFYFLIPLTAITLLISIIDHRKIKNRDLNDAKSNQDTEEID